MRTAKTCCGNPNYQVPMLLEATTCILMEYMCTGIRRYSAEERTESWTYTRCKEFCNHGLTREAQILVGGFLPTGLDINKYHYLDRYVGVAALRKL